MCVSRLYKLPVSSQDTLPLITQHEPPPISIGSELQNQFLATTHPALSGRGFRACDLNADQIGSQCIRMLHVDLYRVLFSDSTYLSIGARNLAA